MDNQQPKKDFYCHGFSIMDWNQKCHNQCEECAENNNVDFLQGFINQFQEGGEYQELCNNEWNVSDFLHWLKANKFKIVKNAPIEDLKEKVKKAINVLQELPIDEVSKQGGISALKLILNE